MNEALIELLRQEFRLQEDSGDKPRLTIAEQAEYLHVNTSYLSKIRSGNQQLTLKKARQIAEALRKGNAVAVQELEARLLAVTPRRGSSLQEVSEWFKVRAREKSIMVVEFRDFGLVGPNVRTELADIVGQSLVDGLDYSMIRPFPDVRSGTPKLPKLPNAVYRFLSSLQEQLTATYTTILKAALKCASERFNSQTSRENKLRELEAVSRRLRLYELATDGLDACVGVGYRLFYTEKKPPENGTYQVPTGQTLWEWVFSSRKHHLIPKESNMEELESTLQAVTHRFFPILEFWRKKGCLPQTNEEIESFKSELEKNSLYTDEQGIDPATHQWSVKLPPANIFNEYL